jgi:hypothetical protein
LNDADQSEILNKECDKGCKDQKHIACGGDNYMSIYRIESAGENLSLQTEDNIIIKCLFEFISFVTIAYVFPYII